MSLKFDSNKILNTTINNKKDIYKLGEQGMSKSIYRLSMVEVIYNWNLKF